MPLKVRSYNYLYPALTSSYLAHKVAYEVANVLHRDVSVGEILLDSKGHGLLIDGDLSKDITLQEARVTERTVSLVSWRLLTNSQGNVAIHVCSAAPCCGP